MRTGSHFKAFKDAAAEPGWKETALETKLEVGVCEGIWSS